MAAKIIPAVQYVRMSTEHQQYSLANQAAAIQRYAEPTAAGDAGSAGVSNTPWWRACEMK